MSVPQEIIALTERFERNREAYTSGQYNETQLRREFLDPFFEALGWDVNNKKGYAEAYKEVIHEDAIKIGGYTKAPDYCFRIGGTRKFFVEAKKPSVKLKDEISPAFQLRRYAWSARLPLSILTDFDEFVVYDCRIKPDKADKSSTARILYSTYNEYQKRWNEISSIFSLDAILKGSFDKYVESGKGKKGTAEVDAAFLKEIENWRELLARNIALRNPSLTQRELNFAVQQTIDRIIFLRICEDRGIEEYNRLLSVLNGANVYQRLCQLFRRADEKYNSGLFHFTREREREEPDELTLNLTIDDNPLKDIIKGLYYPDSPYEFSVLPSDILGQVYEQFLGKVIRLTDGHRAVVEDKPEVKKAGGVYYTPTYIVDYIVKNTVGHLVGADLVSALKIQKGEHMGSPTKKSVTPKDVSKIRILDPACGSGSFLIGAYQYLLDWHLQWYSANDPESWTKKKNAPIFNSPTHLLTDSPSNNYRLTTAEKKRILLNNIYGVDIDPQAVEVTKLSLLLKVLEGESDETLSKQLKLFQERALPDLGSNIKCGNSLIGPDFYDGSVGVPKAFGMPAQKNGKQQKLPLLDEEERYRINVFDWNAEFPEIMKAGGFDAVIGNPPYIRMEGFKELKVYFKTKYASHDERSDLYTYFIERAHNLLKNHGRFGMIVSNKFLRANYGRLLREFLLRNAFIERMVDFAGLRVFQGATVRTVVMLTLKGQGTNCPTLYSPPLPIETFNSLISGSLSVQDAIIDTMHEVPSSALSQPIWNFAKQEADTLLTRLKAECILLTKYCSGQVCMGIKSGLTEAFVINKETRASILRHNLKAEEIIKPFLNGRDIRRYHIDYKGLYVIYTYHGVDITTYPALEQHLKPFKDRLQHRATRQAWYELQQPQHNFAPYMNDQKIIFPDIATSPRFALDEDGYYSSNTTYFIPLRDLYLLGILNSAFGNFYFTQTCAGLEGANEIYLRFFGQYLEGFPIRPINFSAPTEKARHDKMVSLVEQMLSLNKQLASAKTAHDKTILQRQIDATDKQIDLLVYELYGLTEEEIRIVEGE